MSARVLRGPDFKYSNDESTFGEFFFKNAEKYSDRICQIDATINKSETFGSVKLRSARVAIALQKRGITSQDVITFCTTNTLDNTIPMLASYYLGAVVTNLETSLSVRHTKHLLSLVTPKIIFVDESAVGLIEESLIGTDFSTEIIVFGNSEKYPVFTDLVKPQENEEEFRPADVDPDGIAMMLFSSGTTGLPKAICHSHRSFLLVVLQTYQSGASGMLFHFTTFYWLTAFMFLTATFKSGATRVFYRNPSSEDIFRTIETYKVTYMFMAPIIAYKLTTFENPNKYDTSSLKLVTFAGTPMATSQLQKVRDLFPNALIVLVYGLSEQGLGACYDLDSDQELAKQKLSSSGKTAPGVQLKVVDPDTEKLLGPNQKGEIRFKSPSMMIGYYRGDFSQNFDKEGFLKTGDVGYYDEDDYIYVIERIKEMFKYQSWHIIPTAIEAVLQEHQGIKEAVVFGIPNEEDGEVPAAAVVPKNGYVLSEEEIDEFLKKKVADRERLRGGVTFLENLPRTPSGKLVRKEVRDFVLNKHI